MSIRGGELGLLVSRCEGFELIEEVAALGLDVAIEHVLGCEVDLIEIESVRAAFRSDYEETAIPLDQLDRVLKRIEDLGFWDVCVEPIGDAVYSYGHFLNTREELFSRVAKDHPDLTWNVGIPEEETKTRKEAEQKPLETLVLSSRYKASAEKEATCSDSLFTLRCMNARHLAELLNQKKVDLLLAHDA